MEILVGRLTADAKLKAVSDDRQVVNFTIAINRRSKVAGEWEDKAIFIDCSFWRNIKILPFLKKGNIVELYGSITPTAWINQQGEAQAAINCNVNSIIMHGGGKRDHDVPLTEEIKKPTEDLPF